MLLIVVCLFASSVAVELIGSGPGLYQDYHGEYAHSYDDYKPKDYQFNYGVSDPHTGDHKSQWEVKEKGVVRGGYSLLEPDGTTRIVEYVADDHGFRAVVKKIDQHGNTHVESHGNPESHPLVQHEAIQVAQPEAVFLPEFATYNGHVENYKHAQVLPELLQIPPQVEHVAYPEQIAHQEAVPQEHVLTPQQQEEFLAQLHQLHLLPQEQVISYKEAPVLPVKKEEIQFVLPTHDDKIISAQNVLTPKAEGLYYAAPTVKVDQKLVYPQEQQIKTVLDYLQSPVTIHPHGESSARLHAITNNPEDDSAYTNYQKNGFALEQHGEIVPFKWF